MTGPVVTVPRNGTGVWKVLAIALLTALLTGAGVLVLNATSRTPPPDLSPLESRVAVQEEKSRNIEAWLQRVETKLDQALRRAR